MSSILFYCTRMRKKLKKNRFFFNFFGSPVSRIVPTNVKGDLKKAYLTSISSASRSNVAFSVSSSQLIKLIKSVTSLVLKSHYYSLRFLRKEPTKNMITTIHHREVGSSPHSL